MLHSEKYYGQVPWHLASMGREGYLTEEDISLEDILAMSAAVRSSMLCMFVWLGMQ